MRIAGVAPRPLARRPALVALALLVAALGLAFPLEEAAAQIAEDNTLDAGIISLFDTTMRAAQARILSFLTNTFWLLATLEMTYALAMTALNDEGLDGIFRELVRRILFIGFFYALLQNGIVWTDSIIDTFSFIGTRSVPGAAPGSIALSPDAIVDLGLELMKGAAADISIRELGPSLTMLVATVISFIALLIIAGNLALVLIEFYIVGYGGIVLLALGGSRWTSGYAVAYLRYTLAIGMKLFVLFLVVGVGYDVLAGKVQGVEIQNINQAWTLAAFCFVLCFVATRVPDAVNGLLNGVTSSAAIGVTQAMQALSSPASTIGAAAVAGAGAGAAGYQAARLGSERSGNTAVNAAGALAGAVFADVKATQSGSVFPGAGTRGGRAARTLSGQRVASAEYGGPARAAAAGGGAQGRPAGSAGNGGGER